MMTFRKHAFNYGFYIDLYKTFSALKNTSHGRFSSLSSLNNVELRNFYSARKFYENAKLTLGTSNRRVKQASSNGLFNKSIKSSILLPSRFHSSDSSPNSNSPNEHENKAGWNAKEFLNQEKRMNSSFVARQFLDTLNTNELALLKEELLKFEKEISTNQLKDSTNQIPPVTWKQISFACLQTGLPFIGFGFVDNFLMIVFGDMIESYIGFFFPISTMAAAGLGNAVSDVAGIGLAHHIEFFCSKIITDTKISPEQWNDSFLHWCIVISKSICIFVGCLIGMTPLLFINHGEDKNKKSKD